MKEVAIIVVCGTLGFCLSYFFLPRHGEVVYNCTWVEISPDVPPKVREECRKLRTESIK